MLQSPTIPSILAILAIIGGCQTISENIDTNPQVSTIEGKYKLCPQGHKFVQRKNESIICGKLIKGKYHNMKVLIKAKNNKYRISKTFPKHTVFAYKNKTWQEYFSVHLENNKKKYFQLNSWQWQCDTSAKNNDVVNNCFLVSQHCINNKKATIFPNLSKTIQAKASNKKELLKLNANVLEKLVLQAKSGDIFSLEILSYFEHWFLEEQFSRSRANYYRESIQEQLNNTCNLNHNHRSS